MSCSGGASSRGCQRRACLRCEKAIREAIRKVHGRKTAGSRRNGSLRKIWSEVSWRMSSARRRRPGAVDVATQRRIGVTEKLFQCRPVTGLSEKDQQGLVGRGGLLRLSSVVHA